MSISLVRNEPGQSGIINEFPSAWRRFGEIASNDLPTCRLQGVEVVALGNFSTVGDGSSVSVGVIVGVFVGVGVSVGVRVGEGVGVGVSVGVGVGVGVGTCKFR
jgi:hypothetical protein